MVLFQVVFLYVLVLFMIGIIHDYFNIIMVSNIYASLFNYTFFFFLANMGFPGTCGFPGEFLITIGVFEHRPLTIIYAGISLIFCVFILFGYIIE